MCRPREGSQTMNMRAEEEDEDLAGEAQEPDEDEAVVAPTGDDGESSLDELLAKRQKTESEAAEEPEEEAIAPSTAKEERVESLSVKVIPQQPTEFTCRNCFLVKHRSQLANKRKMLCRDCA